MKATILILTIFSSLTLFSQSSNVAGDYMLKMENEGNHLFEYKLTLVPDGTFHFHYYSNIKQGIPPEVNKYAKGKWTEEKSVVSFFSDKSQDLDEKHTLDFSNTKARFVTKSPRNKTDQIIKTQLKFLKSDIFWMRGLDMFKI